MNKKKVQDEKSNLKASENCTPHCFHSAKALCLGQLIHPLPTAVKKEVRGLEKCAFFIWFIGSKLPETFFKHLNVYLLEMVKDSAYGLVQYQFQ